MAMAMTKTDDALAPEIIDDSKALEATVRAESDIQISTAKNWPMHTEPSQIEDAVNRAIGLATQNPETAAACMYALPRGGSVIEGRSVRLAEIMVSAWGNLRVSSRVVGIDKTHVTVEGLAHDLETNTAFSAQVKRRITDRHGNRFNDDLITVSANAASSIAIRNAVFKVIPAAIVDRVYVAAKKYATGDKQSVEIRRAKAVHRFALLGVTQERVLARVGKADISQIDEDDLATLLGLWNAIQNDEVQIRDAFPPVEGEEGPGSEGLAARLKKRRKGSENDGEAEAPKPETEGQGERAETAESPPQEAESEEASGREKPEPAEQRDLVDGAESWDVAMQKASLEVLWPKVRRKGAKKEELEREIVLNGWEAACACWDIDEEEVHHEIMERAEERAGM